MLSTRACVPDSSMTFAIVNTFEIDWMDTSDFEIAGGVQLAVRRHDRDAVDVRIHFGQRRNVVGVGAFLERAVLRVHAASTAF